MVAFGAVSLRANAGWVLVARQCMHDTVLDVARLQHLKRRAQRNVGVRHGSEAAVQPHVGVEECITVIHAAAELHETQLVMNRRRRAVFVHEQVHTFDAVERAVALQHRFQLLSTFRHA